jgi:hypothetical protein
MAEKISVIALSINQWTSNEKTSADDLGLNNDEIPGFLRLGYKQMVDPKRLLPFGRIKREAERLVAESGVKTAIGVVHPNDVLVGVVRKLGPLKAGYYEEKHKLLNNLQLWRREWIDHCKLHWPDKVAALEEAEDPSAYIERQVQFRFVAYAVSELESLDPSEDALLKAGFREAREGLFWKLVEQAARDCKSMIKALKMNERNGQKTLRPLKALGKKIRGLSFLDNRLISVADAVDEMIERLPKLGVLGDQDVLVLNAFLTGFLEPEEVVRRLDRGEAVWVPTVPDGQSDLVAIDEVKKEEMPAFSVPVQPVTEVPAGAFVF